MKPVVFSIFLEVAVAILQMSDGYQNYALLRGTERCGVSALFSSYLITMAANLRILGSVYL